MSSISIQRIYSGIVTRGRRNAPTYNEVKRDNIDTLASKALVDVVDFRF